MKNRKFVSLLTVLTMLSFSFSSGPVSVGLQNVNFNSDGTSGSVDVYMTNSQGCGHCSDASMGNPTACASGGGTWMYMTDMEESACGTANGIWFDGKVGGFQFNLEGVTIDSTGGAPDDFTVNASTSTILGFSLTGATIDAGSGILVTVYFSGFSNEICFGDNFDCSGNDANIISNASGQCVIGSVWGNCTDGLSINERNLIPEKFEISQNFPNPFNPSTSISFDVAYMDEISIVIYDIAGKEVATLVSGVYTPGNYNVVWNALDNEGNDVASGMYIYRYINREKSISKKMLYLK